MIFTGNSKNKKDLLDLNDLSEKKITEILDLADEIKKNPELYSEKLKNKTLLMIFEKPSLRTRVSFEVGLTQMGGHAIYYDLANSPMGKKESVADTAKTASRYVDIIMARLFSHQQLIELSQNSSVPVINALTDLAHPCQILADLQTIREKKGRLKGLTLCYVGDGNNNVTHSLIFGCALMGINIKIGCPQGQNYQPSPEILTEANKIFESSGAKIDIYNDAKRAVKDSDVVCTDSWMSYHIPNSEKADRVKVFQPFQVNEELMSLAKSDAIFIHCLPAIREMEVTEAVIDGLQSVVFDEAENRLHIQKALLLKLLNLN